jgi:hypothetical protein
MLDQGMSREAYDYKRQMLLSGGDPKVPAPAPLTSPNPSAADRLKELQSLLDQRLISREEYQTKRKAILKGL